MTIAITLIVLLVLSVVGYGLYQGGYLSRWIPARKKKK